MSQQEIVNKFNKLDLCETVNIHVTTDASFTQYRYSRAYSDIDNLGHVSQDFRRSLPPDVLEQYDAEVQRQQTHGLPTPPSSRNNSGASNRRRRNTTSGHRPTSAIVSPVSPASQHDPQQQQQDIRLEHHQQHPGDADLEVPERNSILNDVSSAAAIHEKPASPSRKKKIKLPLVSSIQRFRSGCKQCREEKRRQRSIADAKAVGEPPEPPRLLMSSMNAGDSDAIMKAPPVELCHLIKEHKLDDKEQISNTHQPPPPAVAQQLQSPYPLLRRRSSCPCKLQRSDSQADEDELDDDSSTDATQIVDSPRTISPTFRSSTTTASSQSSNWSRQSSSIFSSRQSSTIATDSPASPYSSLFTTSLSLDSHKHVQPHDVYDNGQCIFAFSDLKSRTVPLKRKTSGRRERKMLTVWHDNLVELVKKYPAASVPVISQPEFQKTPEKLEKDKLTRQFILREFYTTEVTFWSQLYYTKVMFMEPLAKVLAKRANDKGNEIDLFSNLSDLLDCSSRLLCAIGPYIHSKKGKCGDVKGPPAANVDAPPLAMDHEQLRHGWQQINAATPASAVDKDARPTSIATAPAVSQQPTTTRRGSPLPPPIQTSFCRMMTPSDDLLLGKHICEISNLFLVFLRCALDYHHNRKLISQSNVAKRYAMYREKLYQRKETSQFFVNDYMIIPIQRITRYGLLLADLQKHTPLDHPDYMYIRRARIVMRSLAVAMNKAQRR
ncbi:hypothetical protein BC940DRAFT_337909 [Gongronella butleri]|nr:hypothetical protein BC940DRAFT_337909 [Gongronella butleri]